MKLLDDITIEGRGGVPIVGHSARGSHVYECERADHLREEQR